MLSLSARFRLTLEMFKLNQLAHMINNHTPLKREELITARDQIVAKYGPWTAHCIHLGEDVYTVESGPNWRLEHFARIVKDFGYGTLGGVRILDLGCLEGLFAIEFARMGAETVGVELRKANIEKARFAKNILHVDRCRLVQDDVRNISIEKFGVFQIILCAGILYHLDMPDLVRFIQQMTEMCSHLLIVDTHIALENLRENQFELGRLVTKSVDEKTYRGRYFIEHPPGSSPQEIEQRRWSSADNPQSFWFTRTSLYHALLTSGFATVYESLQDHSKPIEDTDRLTFIAVK
jgi:2-polyprenyl-3-methyl-5-hydroxy-6-metoxy-1,4-benzoquinol methylase